MSLLKAGRPTKKDKAMAEVSNTKIEIVRLNLNVPKPFYKKIKQKAMDADMTMTQYVLRATSEYMNK